MVTKSNHYLIIIIILIIALGLRLYNIENKKIGVDEGVTIKDITGDYNNLVSNIISPEDHPPLYFLICFLIFSVTKNLLFVKLFSAIIGTLVVFGIYLISKELFDIKTAVISSILAAFSPFNIFYSQHMRPFILFELIFIFSVLFLIRYLKNKNSTNLFLLAAANIALIYAGYLGAITILLISAVMLLENKLQLSKEIFLTLILPFIAFIPWLLVLINNPQTHALVIQTDIASPTFMDIGYTFFKFTNGINLDSAIELMPTIILFPLLMVCFCLGLLITYKKIEYKNIHVLFWGNLLIMLSISLLIKPIFRYRYVLFLLPLFLIFCAHGISSIKNDKLRKVILTLIVALSLIITVYYYQISRYENWGLNIGI